VFPVIYGLSDHDAQYLITNNVGNCRKNKSALINGRIISESSILTFKEMLSNESWDRVFSNVDVNKFFNVFLNIFLRIFETCFPLKKVKKNMYSNQWITKGIKISCKWKKHLYLMMRATNYPDLKEYYTRYCRLLRKLIRRAKAIYYNGMIINSSNKSKEVREIIKRESGGELKNNPSYSDLREGKVKVGNENVATAFNTYFLSSVNKLVGQSFSNACFLPLASELLTDGKSEIVNIPITEAEVINTINTLRNKTSCGYDGVSNKINKLCGDQIVKPLIYTGCPRRNVPYFGRVFLMLKYADITQNTYVQS
jgi:hypothetical protein